MNQTHNTMNSKNQITETQAIETAKSMLTEGFTISFMTANDADDFIWGYLYDRGLQYKKPIEYVNDNGYSSVALIHQIG